MIDKKTDHLALPLPDEKNMLEDDCPRIRAAFKSVDAHAKSVDEELAAHQSHASTIDEQVAALQARATATEQQQAVTSATVTEQGQTLLAHATALAAKQDDAPPTAEKRGAIRVGAGLHLETGDNGETDVLTVTLAELGGKLLCNDEVWLTESGTFTASVTGWYKVLIIDGGNAGGATYIENSGGYAFGGAAGRRRWHTVYLTSGTEVPVSIGAKGLAGSTLISPGNSSFGELTSEGGAAFPATGDIYLLKSAFKFIAVPGSGPGGGQLDLSVKPPNVGFNYSAELDGVWYGAGGGTRLYSDDKYAAGNGAPGGIYLLWHNPAKAAGPLPEPALLSGRRMAVRAATSPVTVNLYDPETGQGSVWREEDAEARLADGLITEEAWREICAQKAAEEYAAWLADPETLAERFSLLQQACAAKLTETDKLVQPDYPISDETRAEVTAYRQAIRELNHQEGAPWDGGGELTPWPEMPAITKVTA